MHAGGAEEPCHKPQCRKILRVSQGLFKIDACMFCSWGGAFWHCTNTSWRFAAPAPLRPGTFQASHVVLIHIQRSAVLLLLSTSRTSTCAHKCAPRAQLKCVCMQELTVFDAAVDRLFNDGALLAACLMISLGLAVCGQ